MAGRPPGQNNPISFKTIPNRNKTQKWQQAKTYNYDGDEWGNYDTYDEYGAGEQAPPIPQPPSFQYAPQQSHHNNLGQRNVSTPAAAYGTAQSAGGYGSLGKGRTGSFDAGDDRRAFSGPGGYDVAQNPPRNPYVDQRQPGSTRGPDPERMRDASDDYYQRTRQREFSNPAQMPPPLNTSSRPGSSTEPNPADAPATVAAQTAAGFPPRKSSLSGGSPVVDSTSHPTSATASKGVEKPLPFIRPSDIYKRMEEEKEKERASMDSSRPSIDSIQRGASASSASGSGMPTAGGIPVGGGLSASRSEDSQPSSSGRQPSLDPVTEARESFIENDDGHQPSATLLPEAAFLPTDYPPTPGHVLPPVRQISGFGSDLFPSSTGTPLKEDPPNSNVVTRAPQGTDPAAEILQERQPTRAQPGEDPAKDILMERHASTASSLQKTPTAAMFTPTSFDRTHLSPDQESQSRTELQHQPSQGYRSVVSKAFDSGRQDDNSVPATPISRENSQYSGYGSGVGVSRSNTDSTSGISPIMSRVPSAATAQRSQQPSPGVDTSVPPIEEVQEPASASNSRPASSAILPARKPAPGHSRNISTNSVASLEAGNGKAVVEQGYRRSLDPPSSDNSPARTPGLEDAGRRRLSRGLSATLDGIQSDAPDVPDQGAEVVEANLERVTSLQTSKMPSEVHGPEAAGVQVGRGRSGTNYSMREADLARELSTSPEKTDNIAPGIVEDARNTREEFLATHLATPPGTSVSPSSPFDKPSPLQVHGRSNTSTSLGSESGMLTPNKSRVREIKDKYDEMHEISRRSSNASIGSSKSSWSRFDTTSPQHGTSPVKDRSQEESTAGSLGAAEGTNLMAMSRPDPARQLSFMPELPGGWISNAPTPGIETPPTVPNATDSTEEADKLNISTATPRQSTSTTIDEPDLTPTTKRIPLHTSEPGNVKSAPIALFDQAKYAGAALGASLIGNVGVGHNTRDFANAESTEAPKVVQPETADKAFTGENLFFARPQVDRWESDASGATAVSKASVDSVEATPQSEEHGSGNVNTSKGYFPSPLRLNRSREEREMTGNGLEAPRPILQPSLSTDANGQDVESDRLRKDIVRSLENVRQAQDDAAKSQNALDIDGTPINAEQSLPPLPTVETNTHARDLLPSQRARMALASPPIASPIASLEAQRDHTVSPSIVSQPLPSTTQTSPRPGLLDQRFSWENKAAPVLAGTLWSPDKGVNESFAGQPERSPSHLQVVNAEVDASPTSPTKSHEIVDGGLRPPGTGNTTLSRTSSMSGDEDRSRNIPSYYASARDDDHSTLTSIAPVATEESVGERDLTSSVSGNNHLSDTKASGSPIAADSPQTPQIVTSKQSVAAISSGRIPPFRELMAIKDPSDRISRYDSTRETFAAMDTGLSNWLAAILASQPEHAGLQADVAKPYKPAPLATSGTFRGHKSSPSIIKNIKHFTSDGIGGSSSGERKASASGPPSSSAGNLDPNMTVASGSGNSIDRDRMQAKGKDFMKSAGAFSGRAQAGAKGLLAKGKSRFGTKGDKAPPPKTSSSSAHAASQSTAPIPDTRGDAGTTATAIATHDDVGVLRASDLVKDKQDLEEERDVVGRDTKAINIQAQVQTEGDSQSFPTPNTSAYDSEAESRPPLSVQSRSRSSLSATFSRLRQRRSESSQASSSSRPTSFALLTKEQMSEDMTNATSGEGAPIAARPKSRSRSRPSSLVLLGSLWGSSRNNGKSSGKEDNDGNEKPENGGYFSSFGEMTSGGAENVYSVDNEGAVASYERSAGVEPFTSVTSAVHFPTYLSSIQPSSNTSTQRNFSLPTIAGNEKKRKEAWEDSGPGDDITDISPQTPTRRDKNGYDTPERLGVLPSPATVLSSENYVDGGWGRASRPTTAPETSNSTDPVFKRDNSPVTSLMGKSHERKNSDLAALPSQVKRMSVSSAGLPTSTVQSKTDGSLELQEDVSPSLARSTAPGSGAGLGVLISAVARSESPVEEEDVFAAPTSRYRVINASPQALSGEELNDRATTELLSDGTLPVYVSDGRSPIPPADWGEVPAEEDDDTDEFHDANEGQAEHKDMSRSSSISSLESPQSPAARIEGESMPIASNDISPDITPPRPRDSNPTNDDQESGLVQTYIDPMLQEYSPAASAKFQDTNYDTAGTITNASLEGLPSEDEAIEVPTHDLMIRRARAALGGRPMSYVPSGTPPGYPMFPPPTSPAHNRSDVNTDVDGNIAVDLTAFSGPPPGAPPFQQHPLLRNKAPGMGVSRPNPYDEVRRSAQLGELSANADEVAEQRHSMFFRGSETPATTLPDAEPFDISGLSGTQSRRSSSGSVLQITKDNGKQSEEVKGKRSSGIWSTFKRSSTHASDIPSVPPFSAGKMSNRDQTTQKPSRLSMEISGKTIEGSRAGDGVSRRNVLQKPQRSVSTTATPEETKGRRFSSLGKLFGRSSTQGHNTPKPNKLTKAQSPTAEGSKKQRGYGEYEEALRQNRLANWKNMQRHTGDALSFPVPQQAPRGETSSVVSEHVEPPLGGWYAPANQKQEVQIYDGDDPMRRMSSSAVPVPPPFRRLHSGASGASGSSDVRPVSHYDGIPEAFRPIESAFGRPVKPIGPPAEVETSLPTQVKPLDGSADARMPTEHRGWPMHPRNDSVPFGSQVSYDERQDTRQAFANADPGFYNHDSIHGPSRLQHDPEMAQEYERQSLDSSRAYVAKSQPPHRRQESYSIGSGTGAALSPQVSGRSEYERSQSLVSRQDSVPSVPSMPSDGEPGTMRSFSAENYSQQTLQNRNESISQYPRASSWSAQHPAFPPVAEEGRFPYQQAQAQAFRGKRPEEYLYGNYQGYREVPAEAHRQRQLPTVRDQQFEYQNQNQRYPGPRAQERYYATRRSVDDSGRPRRLPMQNSPPSHYHHDPSSNISNNFGGPSPPQHWRAIDVYRQQLPYQPSSPEAQPFTYQRTPSGFSGRRDDMAVSEQFSDLGMDMNGNYLGGPGRYPSR